MRTPIAFLALALCAGASFGGDGVSIRKILFQGEPAPAAPAGATFGAIGEVALGPSGLIVYESTLAGGGLTASNNQYIYAITPTDPPTFELLARDLDLVQGLPTRQYLAPSINSRLGGRFTIASTGEVGIEASIRASTGGAILGEAVMVGPPPMIAPTLYESGPAPGLLPQTIASILSPHTLRLNGATAIHGRVISPAVEGIWRGFAGGMDLVVRTGTQAPGFPAGQIYQDIVNDSMCMDRTGRLFFSATIGNAPASGNTGIFLGAPPAIGAIFKEGDSPPGVPGATITNFVDETLRIVGTEGVISVVARTSGVTDAALITGGSSTYSTLAKDGDPAPGIPGATLDRLAFSRVIMTGDGKTAFSCSLAGAPANANTAIFRGDPSGLQLLLREGDPLPGGGVVPNLEGDTLPWLVNTRGQLALVLNDGIGEGLYCTRPDGDMVLIARTGEVFTTDAGAAYIAFDIQQAFNAQSIDSGRSSWFNNEGQIAIGIRTVGGSNQGLFLIDVENVACPADFNGDDVVDIIDFGVFGSAFGSMTGDPNYDPVADFNNDGLVDIIDFGVFGSQFGNGPAECAI